MASRKRLRDWGPAPGRSAEITTAITSDPDPAKRPPGRKDKRHWCGGKEGREHEPAIVLRPPWTPGNPVGCEWAGRHDYRLIRRGEDNWSVAWLCWHREECSQCGKILRERWQILPAECPAFPGSDEQRARAEREAAEYPAQWREHAARHGRPKLVITGPQGYRRKRAQ